VISEKPWRTESVLRLFLGIVMTVCVGAGIGSLTQSDKLGFTENNKEFAGMVVMAISFHGGILMWIWFFLRENQISWRDAFGFESSQMGRAILWGILGACIFIPVAWGLQEFLARWIEVMTGQPAVQQQAVTMLQKSNLPIIEQAFMGVLAILIAPPAEEMLFRGIFYTTVKQSGFPRAARWATSLLFATMHFNLLSFLPLAVFSFILIDLYEKTGSLWAPITAHSLFNFANWGLLMLEKGLGSAQ
jgi:membrane protease YdiL (CAAX protease family)